MGLWDVLKALFGQDTKVPELHEVPAVPETPEVPVAPSVPAVPEAQRHLDGSCPYCGTTNAFFDGVCKFCDNRGLTSCTQRLGTHMSEILRLLIEYWDENLRRASFASFPEADQLIRTNTVAFIMAAAMDRVGQAERIWDIPFFLQRRWGHLDPAIIAGMNWSDIAEVPEVQHAPTQVGGKNLARTIISVADVIEEEGGGDVESLFGGTFEQIKQRMDGIFGVGVGIARMMVMLRMLYFGLVPAEGGELLPKLDTHFVRVFLRAGLGATCSDETVRHAIIGCSPEEVAKVDNAAWHIGRTFCHPDNPICDECPLTKDCPKLGG